MATTSTTADSAARLLDYHRLSKLSEISRPTAIDLPSRPDPHRMFPGAAAVPLPTSLLDIPLPVVPLLLDALDSVPVSMHAPPQDLTTLATWLYFAAGLRGTHHFEWGLDHLRAVPSADGMYPGEIYVAAFAIDGLPPGLYHFSAKEFSLNRLRGGPETLALLRRGRPDMNFLATAPAVLLLGSVFCRSGWRHGRRGYRQAVIEAGHLLANVNAVATGLGMTTQTRMRLNESAMRELIGLTEDYEYAAAEGVQAMVAWADTAAAPMDGAAVAPAGPLPALARPIQAVVPYGSILAAHQDVGARAIGQREIRPPLTELSPVPSGLKTEAAVPGDRGDGGGDSLRSVLQNVVQITAFAKSPVNRGELALISAAAFRGGTFLPMRPSGPYAALVKPLWVTSFVTGSDSGIWWHDAAADRWALLNRGQYHQIAARLSGGREWLENAAAVCVMVASLRSITASAGADGYRLALLEAGLMAQRMHLAAASLGLAALSFGDFYDDAWRQFLGLAQTGWEPIAITAIGSRISPKN